MKVRHIPYVIDPTANRFVYYENYWKAVALELLLKHTNPQGRKVLDYGSGRGETLKIFSEAGFTVSGTDLDPECVRLSSAFGPSTLLNLADPVGQFGRKSVNVVTCFHVLEHVDNPKETLNNLREIATEYVLIAVPNLRTLQRMFTRKILLEIINEGHLQSWDHWHLLNLAERHCGLKLVEWASDATILPLLSEVSYRLLGQRLTVALETGLFRTMFPMHSISLIGLFRCVK